MKFIDLFIIFIIIGIILSKKRNPKPKCCKGSENFGINLYSTGVSYSDMINCFPSDSICSSGRCILIVTLKLYS